MITLKEVNNFNNFTMTATEKGQQKQRATLSHLGSYLLVYIKDQPINLIRLFNLSDYSQIHLNFTNLNLTILRAIFSLDQKQIILTNTKGIFLYSLHKQTIQDVIEFDVNNKITGFDFTPDFSVLYYLNHSQLLSFNLHTRTPLINVTNSKQIKHSSNQLRYDSKTNTVVTSSDNKTNCTVCKWDIRNNSFDYNNCSSSFYGCNVNQLYILGSQLVITKRKYNHPNFNNTIVVNYTTLEKKTSTSQSISSESWPGFIVPLRNYTIQYFAGSNHIFFYKDNLMSTPFNISYKFVYSIVFNSYKQQLYIVSKLNNNNLTIKTLTPLFPQYNNPIDIKTGTPVGVIVVIIIAILLLIAAALLYYYKKCKKQSEEKENYNEDIEGGTDRQMTEGQKPRSTPTIDSNQQLKSRIQQIDEPHEGSNEPKAQTHNLDPEDLEHFSIDQDDPQKENYFSQIESNIENHLT